MNSPATQPDGDLLDRILAQEPGSFALLHRLGPHGSADTVDILVGDVSPYASLADIPLAGAPSAGVPGGTPPGDGAARAAGPEVLVLVPYRQLAERGFAAPDDGEPLLAMSVTGHQQLPLPEVVARMPQAPVRL